MNYIKEAIKTESNNWERNGMNLGFHQRLLHGSIGISTEAGELLDSLKKTIFYNKPLDKVNLKEELGDLFYYIAIICDELGVSFEELQERNIEKLRARYGEKFTEEKAITRNLEKEREILEK